MIRNVRLDVLWIRYRLFDSIFYRNNVCAWQRINETKTRWGGVMPLPAMPKEERQDEEGHIPLLVASKQQKRNEEGHTPPRRVGKMRKHTILGVGTTALPLPSSSFPITHFPSCCLSCGMVVVAWVRVVVVVVRVARHCRRAVAIVVAVGSCRTSPLVTKWEITHVTGHGAGNPKPVQRVRVFGGYGIPNPYPYPRETHDIP